MPHGSGHGLVVVGVTPVVVGVTPTSLPGAGMLVLTAVSDPD